MAGSFLGGLVGGFGGGAIGSAVVQLFLDDDQYNKQLSTAQGQTTTATKTMGSSFTAFKAVAATAAIAAGAAIVKFGADAVAAASDQEEALNKVNVVFAESSAAVVDFADASAESFGISKTAALDAAGGFGTMLQTAGLTSAAASEMSVELVQLASDLASFNNIAIEGADGALAKLKSGLAGEAEPLRQLGVLLSEARVKEEAYAAGIAEVGAELTEAEKVQARYNLILQDTGLAQGDFERTSDSLANQQRILTARFADAQAEVGQALLPVVNDLLAVIVDLAPAIAYLGEVIQFVIGPITQMSEAMGIAADTSRDTEDRMASFTAGVLDLFGPVNPLTNYLADELRESTVSAGEAQQAVRDLAAEVGDGLGPAIKETTQAAKDQREALRDLGPDLAEGLVSALAEMDLATERVEGSTAALDGAVSDLEREQRDAAEAAREHTEALVEQRRVELELAGGVLGLVSAAQSLSEAQKEVNQLQQQGKEDTNAYREAVADVLDAELGLQGAILDVTDDLNEHRISFQEAREQLAEYGRMADLSGEDLRDFVRNGLEPVRDQLGPIKNAWSDLLKLDPTLTWRVNLEDNFALWLSQLNAKLSNVGVGGFQSGLEGNPNTGGSGLTGGGQNDKDRGGTSIVINGDIYDGDRFEERVARAISRNADRDVLI